MSLRPKIFKFFKLIRNIRYILSLFKGVAAAVEHESVLRFSQASTVIDIGANKGQFALAAIECLPKSRIISFEPLREPARKYFSIFANEPQVKLNTVAIGASTKKEYIHISASNDSSSLYPITPLQEKLFPGTEEVGQELISVETLKKVLSKDDIICPCLLKIDVQGYEKETLKGCEDFFDCFDWIYVECSFLEMYSGQAFADQIITFLRDRDFKIVGVYNTVYDDIGRAVQADFLFQPIHHNRIKNIGKTQV